MKSKALLLLTCLVFTVSFFCAADSGAIPGQTYFGDGAEYNPVVPPGGWLIPTGFTCLGCHNSAADPDFRGPDMTSYLKTGHKNVLRSTPEIPGPLAGPNGQPYVSDQSGNVFNWTEDTITINGFCTNATFTTQPTCTGGGGVWISGSRYLYYIFGGWMGEPPMSLFDGSYIQGTQKTAVSYSCGRCHTTGFTMDTVVRVRNPREPDATFPGITWTPTDTSGTINLDPDGNGPAVASSWVFEGVECEYCHNATEHAVTGVATVAHGSTATALCLNCHRQEHTLSYTAPYNTGLGANIVPTPYTDNSSPSLPTSEPLYPLPAIEVGSNGSYVLGFQSYSIGMEFLNGVHAKYTGNFQQIGDPTRYSSSFVSGPNGSGCTTCHNVHQSLEVAGAKPFNYECLDCHGSGTTAAEGPPIVMANILHPKTAGTPFDTTLYNSPCEVCHMPHPNQGSGTPTHLFRISINPTYSMFPTMAQFYGGYCSESTSSITSSSACSAIGGAWTTVPQIRTATTSPDGTYTNAVWVDLDLACGQCHGGSGGSGAIQNNAPYFDKNTLAYYAANIHNNQAINPSFTISRGSTTLTANVNASGSTCSGSNGNCTSFDWNWGDGTPDGSGVTASHAYTTGGEKVITLTVTQTGVGSESRSQPFNAILPDVGPTASCTFTYNPDTWVATCIDTSTGSPGYPVTAVNVNWGDGFTSSGCKGTTCPHTYLNAAPTGSYNVTVTAIDSDGMTKVANYVSSPSGLLTISGTVENSLSIPVSGASVTLKLGAIIKAILTTNGSGVFTSSTLKPGSTYNVTVTKGGYNFGTAPQKSGIAATYAGTNVGIIKSITP